MTVQQHCDAFLEFVATKAKISYFAHCIVRSIARKVQIMMYGLYDEDKWDDRQLSNKK